MMTAGEHLQALAWAVREHECPDVPALAADECGETLIVRCTGCDSIVWPL